jgi:hypothetical protein
MQSKKKRKSIMSLIGRNIKRAILGLALCSGLGMGAPGLSAQVVSAHSAAHPSYYSCSKYYSNYWGYSYGFYKGTEVTNELDNHDGYDGYNYGTKWYQGYYPDAEYWNFYDSEPHYMYKYYNGYKYRCFAPYQASQRFMRLQEHTSSLLNQFQMFGEINPLQTT